VLLLRGLFGRCPRCGGGKVFTSWLKMKPRCPRCGLGFEREDGFFLGAIVVNAGVVLLSLAAFIGISVAITLPHPDPVKLSIMAVAVAVFVPIFFYPISKTFWSAIDLIMSPLAQHEVDAAASASTD